MNKTSDLEKLYAKLSEEEATKKEFGVKGRLVEFDAMPKDSQSEKSFRELLEIPSSETVEDMATDTDIAAELLDTAKVIDLKMPMFFTRQAVTTSILDFGWYGELKGMEQQLLELLDRQKNISLSKPSNTGHICLYGESGNGRAELGLILGEAICKARGNANGKCRQISAEHFSHKDISDMVRGLSGCALYIDRASLLTETVINLLTFTLRLSLDGFVMVFGDTKEALDAFFEKWPAFAAFFDEKVTMPVPNDDELVSFGERYAVQRGFLMDGVSKLALHSRIAMLQSFHHHVEAVEVAAIVEAAMEHSRTTIRRKLILKKNEVENVMPLLLEKDFN